MARGAVSPATARVLTCCGTLDVDALATWAVTLLQKERERERERKHTKGAQAASADFLVVKLLPFTPQSAISSCFPVVLLPTKTFTPRDELCTVLLAPFRRLLHCIGAAAVKVACGCFEYPSMKLKGTYECEGSCSTTGACYVCPPVGVPSASPDHGRFATGRSPTRSHTCPVGDRRNAVSQFQLDVGPLPTQRRLHHRGLHGRCDVMPPTPAPSAPAPPITLAEASANRNGQQLHRQGAVPQR